MKTLFYTLGMLFQLSGLAAVLYVSIALFNPAADLSMMFRLALFGAGIFGLGWLLGRFFSSP